MSKRSIDSSLCRSFASNVQPAFDVPELNIFLSFYNIYIHTDFHPHSHITFWFGEQCERFSFLFVSHHLNAYLLLECYCLNARCDAMRCDAYVSEFFPTIVPTTDNWNSMYVLLMDAIGNAAVKVTIPSHNFKLIYKIFWSIISFAIKANGTKIALKQVTVQRGRERERDFKRNAWSQPVSICV